MKGAVKMKLFFSAMIVVAIIASVCLVAGASHEEAASESLSGADALRLINSASERDVPEGNEAAAAHLLAPDLAAETEESATVSVRHVGGGLVEVFKANGVVLVYDGEPDEDGALIGARFTDAA